MRIEKLCFYNYGPFFGEHVFSFSRKGLVLVAGKNWDDPRCDSNGSGKSSIFDALDWGLFGRVPRGDHVDSVIHDQATSCQVRVELRDDAGQPLVIERRRGKETNLRCWIGGREVDAFDLRATQEQIERALGMDRDTFHAAVYFGQNDVIRYADATDSERMETLTRILQLEEIDGFLERTKGMLAAAQGQMAEGRAAQERWQTERATLVGQNLSAAAEAWATQRAQELAAQREEYSQRTAALDQTERLAREKLPAAQEAVDHARAALDAVPAAPEIPAEIRQRLAAAKEECGVAKYQLAEAQRAVDTCQPLGETCSLCGQPVPEALRAGERNRRLQVLVAAQQSYQAKERIMQSAQAEVNREETLRAQASAGLVQRRLQLRQHFEIAQRALAEWQSSLQSVEAARKPLLLLYHQIQARAAEANPYLEQIARQAQRVAELDRQIAEQERLNAGQERRLRFLEFWKSAFGLTGLKSYILDARLADLNQAANRWVQLLTGGVWWVKFESQRQTRGKKIVNAPEIRVARWNPDGTITERNYRSLSGGEKQRISFPIDFGLSHLLASRARQRYDLLLLDEVFKHLDRTGKEAMMEMLGLLSREKEAVYVVEHDAEMQGLFEQTVLVQKRNRKSTIIEEIGNEQFAEKTKPAQAQVEHGLRAGAVGRTIVRRPVRRTPVPK